MFEGLTLPLLFVKGVQALPLAQVTHCAMQVHTTDGRGEWRERTGGGHSDDVSVCYSSEGSTLVGLRTLQQMDSLLWQQKGRAA